jgi:hypothetical protein
MLRGVIRAWRYVDGRDGREEVDCPHIREAVDPEHAVVWIDATSPEDEEVGADATSFEQGHVERGQQRGIVVAIRRDQILQ